MADLDISKYPGSLPAREWGEGEPIARFDKNRTGRDFVVGDIHGMFSYLDELLSEVKFNRKRDRLFSVGDLVDRGPESRDSIEWLSHPWFHACRGSHEQFALDSHDPEQLDLWVNYNGGRWWLELTEAEREGFKAAFSELPLAIELETDTGMVGIVRADTPPMLSWEQFMAQLASGDEDALVYAIWSRTRISGEFTLPVEGAMERIYCGHTPTKEAVLVGNVYYIDTGAVYSYEGYQDARLTMVQVHPERHVVYDIRTYKSG